MKTIDHASRRPLGNTGLRCCPLGFGGYRITQGSSEHRAALARYLELGGNLIDTSANYGLGASELLIGEVLRAAAPDDRIIVTKAGYIQGHHKMTASQHAYPDVVKYAPDVWHCIHPRFLSDQLEMSRARLGVERVDVFLLHNPEYYLKDCANRGIDVDHAREVFYRRMETAFEFLESQVRVSRLGWYGISANTFGMPADRSDFVQVSRCLAIAESFQSDHHFRVVQLPMNLYEPGGALECNNAGQSAIDFARSHDLGVLINRPLNAVRQGRLMRLADPPGLDRSGADPETVLSALQSHEEAFANRFDFPLMRGGMGVGGWLGPVMHQVDSMDAFNTIIRHTLVPAVETWMMNADHTLRKQPGYDEWRRAFGEHLDRLLDGIQETLARKLHEDAGTVRSELTAAGLSRSEQSLSQLALAVLLGTDGVSCVLNGMRSTDYVDDSMQALGSPISGGQAILCRLDREGVS